MTAIIDDNAITVTSPDVHDDARMTFAFHRTLRVPDDGSTYDLPPSLGPFPLRSASKFPTSGSLAMMPMWQAEACWIDFTCTYPHLVTIGAGSINAVTGDAWSHTPDFDTEDYFEVPEQPWLDGFNVATGEVRQFVAMPLGTGVTVEEQVSDADATGGINVAVYPLLASKWEESTLSNAHFAVDFCAPVVCASPPPMGLAGGGSIRQSIKTPVRNREDWDLEHGTHFRIEILNSTVWREMTGEVPPTHPPTAAEYARHSLPWFTWYDDRTATRQGSDVLKATSSITAFGPVDGNDSFVKQKPHVVGPV